MVQPARPSAASAFVPRPDVSTSTMTQEEAWQQRPEMRPAADGIPVTPPLRGERQAVSNQVFYPAGARPYQPMGPGQNMGSPYSPMNPAQSGAQTYMAPQNYGQPIPVGYPPLQKKKHTTLFVVLGVSLALLVILCGALAIISTTLNKHLELTTPSTANNQAQSTPLPTPAGKPVLVDNFADNTNKWELFHSDGYGAEIQKHQLILSEMNGKTFLEHVPGAEQLGDFQLDMTYTSLQTDHPSYTGIIFRRQNVPGADGLRSYELKISATTGQYMIKKVVAPPANHAPDVTSATISLASGLLDTKSAPGQPTRVSLIVKGNTMTLYVNDAQVTSCDDNTSTPPYTTGAVNLMFQNGADTSTDAKVAISHISLYSSSSDSSSGPSI
ncbi:hypothetical protein KDW_46040 [Dictyobacter vulcani]|uniref:3-keto-disaccharide hydrolase domain-containing protein n=2 Tax=Dictyobacter vulcani TaxID=2607529 RepID=A0A5J4KTE9_9CHLR|nr:hypothetical protein KDW_46040 [Dictyobacter vulcani]